MGKTVTTYLIDGDLKGTQYVEIDDKICKMYVIPRSNLAILRKKTELLTPALYILLGEDNETTKLEIYIGQTGNFQQRAYTHNNDEDNNFWQKTLLFISQGVPLTTTDVQYLEYRAIVAAKKVLETSNTFIMDKNEQIPRAPVLPEPRVEVMKRFFSDVKFLTSFVGYNIFDVGEKKHLFYTKGRDGDPTGFYDARGLYDDANGFTVLKGSIIAKLTVDSYTGKEKRENLLKDYTEPNGDNLVLKSDITFPTPSAAANFCIGSNQNGWLVWKNKGDQTLKAVYRRSED